MNKRNLTKLLNHLEKQRLSKRSAGRFNMAYWGESTDNATTQVLDIPVCKTQACMAGEATIALGATEFLKNGGLRLTTAASNKFGSYSIAGVAGSLLGLTSIEQKRLFYLKMWGYADGWPKKYEDAYTKAKTPRARLTVAINRLKHFIKTDGAE